MKFIKSICLSYVRSALFFGVALYATTASPDGTFKFAWNWANGYVIAAYGLFYPLLIWLVPHLRLNPIPLTSLGTRATRITPKQSQNLADIVRNAHSRDHFAAMNEQSDDEMNLALNFVLQAVLLLLSLPILLGVILVKYWHRVRRN